MEKQFTEKESLELINRMIGADEADFLFLKEMTGATAGNLSVQIEKLREAGYFEVTKSFKGKFPGQPAGSPPQESRHRKICGCIAGLYSQGMSGS